jgi:sulfide:quinone oxidoreductase
MERYSRGLNVECMAGDGQPGEKQRVLIAGGGIAGVEAALALRDLAMDWVEVALRDPRREFVFKPFAVGEPYGAARIFRYGLEALARRCGASYEADAIVSVDPGRRLAETRDGERLPYDYLVIASGVRMLAPVPGAVTFWGVADEGQVAETIASLRAGALRRLVFTMPGGRSWALPLYELALLAATELAKAGTGGTQITVVTPEDSPLELFGQHASEQMAGLLDERGIEVLPGAHPVGFEARRLRIAPGKEIEADAVISLPRLQGRRIDGIPHDSDGFAGVDEHGRVIGLERVFAAGDVTNFPVKQGGIATQQADTAAEAIAAETGGGPGPRPFDPILRGVLWTGAGPRYLYGRPTGGHGDASSLSEEPQWRLERGKVAGRYITPFLRSLVDEIGSAASVGSAPAR